MDLSYKTISLNDLAAASTTGALPERLAFLKKVQHFTLGAAAVGTDLTIVDAAPAAGEVQLSADDQITLGTASVAGDMYVVEGVPVGAYPGI